MTSQHNPWDTEPEDPEAARLRELLKEPDWTQSVPKPRPTTPDADLWADVGDPDLQAARWQSFLAQPDWTLEVQRAQRNPEQARRDREARQTFRHRILFEQALGADLSVWSPAQMQEMWKRTAREVRL